MTDFLCTVCGHTRNSTVLTDYPAAGRSWDLVQCRHCGLIRTYPMPDDKVLSDQYSDNYRAAGDDASTSMIYNLRMNGLARKLRKLTRSGDSALDVGAGNGAWTALLLSHGFDATGIDPYAEESSAPRILTCSLEDAPFENQSIDLITFMHVLEHLKDPVKSLGIAVSLLKPGGLLVVEVPNIESLGYVLFKKRWFPLDDIPSHISHFSRESLSYLVRQTGEFVPVMDSGFSLKDSPSILANTLFPGLCPRTVRKNHAGRHPLHLKIIYLLVQLALLPVAWIAARTGRGEVIRLVLKKPD